MFERLRPAYYGLVCLSIALILLAAYLSKTNLVDLIGIRGVRTMLIASGGLFPLVWITGVALAITYRKVDLPTRTLWKMIVRRRKWLLRGTFFVIVVSVFARSFSNFKSNLSRLNYFWADPWLADLDKLTFGEDPWRLTHALIGPVGTVFIDRIYILWFMMMFLTLGWFCFTRNAKLQVRGLLCFVLSWGVLGDITAVALSSVGPCFYQDFYNDGRFTPLMATLRSVHNETPLAAVGSMNFLISTLGENRFGSGISAMPSLHVTIAMLSFLATKAYARSLTLKIVSGVFTACIFVGSVHLGWHYAWDGIFGIAAVILFWWGSGKFVDWIERREARNPANSATIPLPATS